MDHAQAIAAKDHRVAQGEYLVGCGSGQRVVNGSGNVAAPTVGGDVDFIGGKTNAQYSAYSYMLAYINVTLAY